MSRSISSVGTIVQCRYLVISSTEVIEDAAIAYQGDTIIATGSRQMLLDQYPGFHIEGSPANTIAMPGLINSHHHGWGLSTMQLGVSDDYLEPWLIDLISLPPVNPYLDTLWSAIKQIRSGVTTVQHATFVRSPAQFEEEIDAYFRAYDTLGMRAIVGVQARDQNSYVYQNDDEFLKTIPTAIRKQVREAEANQSSPDWNDIKSVIVNGAAKWKNHQRLDVEIAPEGPEWCSEGLLSDIAKTARSENLRVHMHCLESPVQTAYLQGQYGVSVIEKLRELDFLGPHLSLAHAVWMSKSDLEICAAHEVSLCHNPSSNLRLRNGIFPLETAYETGVSIGLGLDSTTLNDNDNMLEEMRHAFALHRKPWLKQNTNWTPQAEDIFHMATVGGATTIGKQGTLGELREGFKADFVLLDANKLFYPFASKEVGIIEHILTQATSEMITDVVIAGEPILADGEFTDIDEAQIAKDLSASAKKTMPEEYVEWREAMKTLKPYVQAFYENWGK